MITLDTKLDQIELATQLRIELNDADLRASLRLQLQLALIGPAKEPWEAQLLAHFMSGLCCVRALCCLLACVGEYHAMQPQPTAPQAPLTQP